MIDVTEILNRIESGDPSEADRLLPIIYDELRRLARAKMKHESPDHTLQPTALVHEAFFRMVNVEKARHWDSRRHFFSAAAESMRRILVDHARRKKRLKRGGDKHRVLLEEVETADMTSKLDLLALHEALNKLSLESPEKAEVVQLRFFGGLGYDELAAILGVSTITVKRHWRYARVWLLREIEGNQEMPKE